VQTLRQLLPAETFGSKKVSTDEPFDIPCVQVEDYPRFGWRGMHLDVSRHFFDVQFVKRYLDRPCAA
jgi:hexosaminidase